MAINVNQFQPGALQAAAGNVTPNYSLPLHSITGASDFANAMAARQDAGVQQDQNQQQIDLANRKQVSDQAMDQQKMALMQQEMNIKKQEAQQKSVQNALEVRKAQDDTTLKQKLGASASVIYGSSSIMNDPAKSPAQKDSDLKEFQKSNLDTAYAKGIISKDEYQQGLNLPPAQFLQKAQQEFLLNQAALNSKNLDIKKLSAPAGDSGAKMTADQSNVAKVASLNSQIDEQTKSGQTPDPALIAQRDQLQNIVINKGKSPTDQGEKEIAVNSIKVADKEAGAARTDQVNVEVMRNLLKNPDLASGSLANASVSGKKFLAAASGIMGIPYDPKTAPSEAFNDVAVRAQIDFVKMIGQRINQTEWNAAGNAVPKITNTPQGRELLVGMVDYNNEMKIKYNSFINKFYNEHKNLVGAQEAWDNFVASVGSPYNPQTKQFDGGDKIRNSDFRPFATDVKYQQPNAVHLDTKTTTTRNGEPTPEQARAELARRGIK